MADLAGTYEVFLSFRGKDTRDGFTDYLYNDLISAGVVTFRDDNELRIGEEIGSELIKAISHSKISIPIFSNKYADSKWCLRELALMVEQNQKWGQKIFPIFYDVDPSDFQHYERGRYYESFLQFENDPSLDQNIVQQWKNALAIVGELKGLELQKETNGHEGSFVKMIVQKVLLELKKGDLNLPKNLVGIDHHMERLKELLLNSSKSDGVKMIGILGMSGLGKTTIAKAIYNQLNELFDSHCFIHDVREELQRGGLLNLQNQFLCKILQRNIRVHNVDEGSDKIKKAICNKKVFLVLDNVDDISKIKELLVVNHSCYGGGSRIIITTTNEEVLLAIKLQCEGDGKFDVYEKYEPQLMSKEDALELFSKCAFKRESPPDDFLDLANEVVIHARGLPLVLETLGSLLSIENDKVYWKEKLNKLRKVPPSEVVERLKISYDTLDFGQKQIFLDIACFFVGHDVTNPSYMWDACGFHASEGIRALERRSLIKFIIKKGSMHKRIQEDETVIWMHDQLRELGKQIINKSFTNLLDRSRLWVHCEALEALERHTEQKSMEAICLQFDKPDFFSSRGAKSNYLSRRIRVVKSYLKKNWEYTYPHVTGQEFEMLPKLRYLSIDYCDMVGDFKYLHTNLRWIRWIGCSGNSEPSNLCLKNIVIFDLSCSRISHKWKWWNEIKMAEKLKVLNLTNNYYLAHVPHLTNFTSLERLDLNGCHSLIKLDGLEQLESLTYLNVSYCSLKTLPNLTKLRKLRTLKLCYLLRLVMIQGLETLESLELLDVTCCYSLQRLPDMSNLHNLISFKASRCNKLTEVQGLDGLRSLEHFHMIYCPSINTYPDISNNKKLRTLVACFSKGSEVEGLGELEALEQLVIHNTECLSILPELSKLTRLRELEIYHCNKLIEIKSLRGLESLKYFRMSSCSSVRRTTFADLKMLQYVKIHECKKLTQIRGLEGLDSLKVLTIITCGSIKNLPDLSSLKKLWCINLSKCWKLTEIRGLEQLTSLTRLNIVECKSLGKNLLAFVTSSYDRLSDDEDEEDEDV